VFGTYKGEIAGWGNCTVTSLVLCALQQIKSRRLRWAERVVRRLEEIYANRILVGKPEGKRPFGILA
jgi:hypothetical protein